MPYLTPNSLAGDSLLSLSVPDDPLARSAVLGQLLELTRSEFWEQFGTETAQATALEFQIRFASLEWDS